MPAFNHDFLQYTLSTTCNTSMQSSGAAGGQYMDRMATTVGLGSGSSTGIHSLPPELLHMVFEQLAYEDLQNARGVSKYWRDALTNPIKAVRQAQFLEADNSSRGRPIHIWISGHMITPTGHFVAPEKHRVFTDYPDAELARPVVVGHPMLSAGMREQAWPEAVLEIGFPFTLGTMLSWKAGGKLEKSLLTQPPQQKIHLFVIDENTGLLKRVEVNCPQCLTFGAVVEALKGLAFPRSNLLRAAKVLRPTFDTAAFSKVVGIVEGVVTSDCNWVKQAQAFEQWDEEIRAMEAVAESGEEAGQDGDEDSDVEMADEFSTPAYQEDIVIPSPTN